MASAPADFGPVTGRIDRHCRLIAADPELEALQVEAGSNLGAELALPQIAAIGRLALKLGVPLSRPAVVASADQDIELWVRATPRGDEVDLSLEHWRRRPPAPPRLHGLMPVDQLSAQPADEWVTDAELRLQALSPRLAAKAGVELTQAIGQPLTRFFRIEEDTEGALPLVAGVAARVEFSGQRARLRSGEQDLLTLSGTPLEDADGCFVGFTGLASVEAEQAPGQASAELSEIDAAVDEALRSPLDRIIENADRIVQQSDGPLRSDYAEYATDIAAAARHLLSVVRSMSGEDGRRDQVDLASLSADAAGMLESAAEARDVRITLSVSSPLMAEGDARGVVQILVNLIGNAVRHSPAGGTVTVSSEVAGDGARVHVVDCGPGIALSDQQRIFERFEQGRPGEGGAGLGLAIARRLARAMGGDIRLESTPGKGACFTLLLPGV